MGQKVHPKSLRLGFIQEWDSKWFAKRNYPALLEEDFKIRAFIKERHKAAGVALVGIERAGKYIRVNIHTARPGIIIGRKGNDVENLRKALENMLQQKTYVNILEVKSPELNALLVAESIAAQLERKIAFRRAMKKAIERSLAGGALGIKVMVAGRLGGAEIARTEWLREGRIPLHTFRADIDYGFTEACTTYGQIGVKVWIFKKEYFDSHDVTAESVAAVDISSFDEKQAAQKKEEVRNDVDA